MERGTVPAVRVYPARVAEAEAGLSIMRAIPSPEVGAVGPFVMIDHYGPVHLPPGGRFGFPPHPHAGIATVSMLLRGQRRHRDSIGNDVEWSAGDVQWMSAGRGVVHEEGIPREFKRIGGVIEGLQIWLNLPGSQKRGKPVYEHVPAGKLTRCCAPGYRVAVILGRLRVGSEDVAGPITPPLPAHLLTAAIDEGGTLTLSMRSGESTCVYVCSGTVAVNGAPLIEHQIAILEDGVASVDIEGISGAQVLILGGAPYREPAVFHGPFVMSSAEEISDAYARYTRGEMGRLAPEGIL